MTNRIFLAVIAAMTLAGTATAAELPSFELLRLPITPHQAAVVGSADMRERSSVPVLTVAGMPASPHQIAVLTPRARATEEASVANLNKGNVSAR